MRSQPSSNQTGYVRIEIDVAAWGEKIVWRPTAFAEMSFYLSCDRGRLQADKPKMASAPTRGSQLDCTFMFPLLQPIYKCRHSTRSGRSRTAASNEFCNQPHAASTSALAIT